MAVETALSFLRALEQARALPAAFAIAGPQAFLREYVLDALRAMLARKGRQFRGYQVGAGGDFAAVLNELREADLFASRKAVVCRVLRSRRGADADVETAAEPRRGTGADESALAEAIEKKGLAGELVLIYERDSVPAKMRRVAERAGVIINCLRPFDNQLAQYAQAFAQALGIKLAPEATDVLVSCCASDLAAMSNAIAKASIVVKEGERIMASDVLDSGAARIPELFDLAESLARGQISLTLALLDRAIAVGRDAFEVLAVELIPVIRRMLTAAAMLEQGRRASDVAAVLGLNPASGLMTRTIEGARRFGLERLRRAHHRASQLDAGFKMGLLKEREAALSELLMELAAAPA
jgi:DNA polymerase III delta subunit